MVTAVVLAAGAARRFGSQKVLVEIDGMPLVRHAVASLLSAGIGEPVIVTGWRAPAVRRALEDLPIRFAFNPRYREGLASSLARGIRAVRRDARVEAALIALGDQPGIEPAVVRLLVSTLHASGKAIAAPEYAGTPGNPVLFRRSIFSELLHIGGDRGARDVVRRDPRRVATVRLLEPPPFDIDTRGDYAAALGRAWRGA